MSDEITERVRVVVDMREDALWDALEPEEGYILEKAPLDVGDIAFFVRTGKAAEGAEAEEVEAVVLERKTVEDLAASQRDGRYREQRARLLAKKGGGAAVGYVLEVPPIPWGSRGGTFKESHLLNTILRLQCRYGLAVFQGRTVTDTATWVCQIARALVADPAVFRSGLAETTAGVATQYTEALHVKKAMNLTADRVLSTVLRTIPGVGLAAAEGILTFIGSGGFPRLYELSEKEIAAIPLAGSGSTTSKRKVGPATAKKLWGTFHGTSIEPTPDG